MSGGQKGKIFLLHSKEKPHEWMNFAGPALIVPRRDQWPIIIIIIIVVVVVAVRMNALCALASPR